jgi:putative ATPase
VNLKEKIYKPLSVRLRPTKLEEFVGQEHILAEGKLLRRQIEEDKLTSMILYGPSGCGKTSLASVIAASTNCEFFSINATTSGVLDIKRILERAHIQKFASTSKKIILLIEEIHRFNRPQQDALLPDVEEANIIIIGTTNLILILA